MFEYVYKMDGETYTHLLNYFNDSVERWFAKKRTAGIWMAYELTKGLEASSPEKRACRDLMLDTCIKQMLLINEPKELRRDNERRFIDYLNQYCEQR